MNGSSNKVEEFLERLNEITNANLSNSQFGVSELAREMGMSRSNLHRKVRAAAKISVSQFISHERLKHAMEMLRQTSLTVSEVSWETGFGSVSYFIKCFREYYGFPPGEVGNREIENNNVPNSESTKAKKRKITVLLIGSSVIVLSVILYLMLFHLPGKEGLKEKISTKNPQALYLFNEGQELQRSASLYKDVNLAQQAKEKYEMALKLDSGFVPPMVQLGWIYVGHMQRNFATRLIYLDSALYYANRAIKFDKEYASAYNLLGRLHHVSGNIDKAFESFNMALQYDKNGSVQNLALLYFETGKYVKAIDLLYKQLAKDMETNPNENYWILFTLKQRLELLGFYEESNKYTDLILKQNNDSTAWLNNLMHTDFIFGNYDSVTIFADRWLKGDTLKFNWYQNLTWTVPWSFLFLKNYEESFRWFQKYIDKQASDETISYNSDGLAFLYLKYGQNEKADSAFDASIRKLNFQIEYYNWQELTVSHILLASVYSAMGEIEKAIETLRQNKSTHLLAVTELKYNPMFDKIRNEPEFQVILALIESEYQKIHDEVAVIVRKYEN